MIVEKQVPTTIAGWCRNMLVYNLRGGHQAWFVSNANMTPSFRTTLQRASKQTGIKITTKREPEGLYIWRKE